MKKSILIFICLLLLIKVNATNYYVSASGNDTVNLGTSSLSPWKTIEKLNATVIYAAGDTVFFRAGDVFRGQVNVSNANHVVFTSYGAGDKPVISGADPVTSWTFTGDYYQASFTEPVANFFVNDKEQILARYPDEGQYLTVDAATTAFLQDADLASIPSAVLNESQVCVHTKQWCWEKSEILSSSGNQINYATATTQTATVNFGYFLYDDTTYLTTAKEWKYDSIAQLIYYIPVFNNNPNASVCEASVRSYGIMLDAGVSNITITNLAFEKQSESGVAILYDPSDSIKIDNCYFARQYKFGVDVQGRYTEISNSYFREVDGLAIYIHGTGFGAEVHHNTFRNNGGFRNSGIGQEINLSAVKGAFVDSCHIHHNDIDSTGYCGISMDGKYNLIERNIVQHAMLLNNDGAALKAFGPGSQYSIFRNNFVSSSDGNTEGTSGSSPFITPAIYFDFSTNNCTIQENTIFNRTKKGIFQNSANRNNTIIGNVVHGGNYCLDLNGSQVIPTPAMTGMIVKHNSFFAKDPDAYIIRQLDHTDAYNTGIIDSNYYFQPYDDTIALRPPDTYYNFTEWQATGNDVHTRPSFVSWTWPIAYDSLFMNQTDNVVTINLGTTKYLGLDSNVVCGSITLQPYTSKILINTTTTCSTFGITENGMDKSVTIYPNPCHSEIKIARDKNIYINQYEIHDLFGRMVDFGVVNTSKNSINTEKLMPGIYFVLFRSNDTIYISKIIKE